MPRFYLSRTARTSSAMRKASTCRVQRTRVPMPSPRRASSGLTPSGVIAGEDGQQVTFVPLVEMLPKRLRP